MKLLLPAISAALVCFVSPTTTASTLAHWEFEGEEFLKDSSTNGVNLQNEGVAQEGGAAVFDGSGVLETGTDLVGAAGSRFTIEMILTAKTSSGRRPIAGEYRVDKEKPNGWELYLEDENVPVLELSQTRKFTNFFSATLTEAGGKEGFALEPGVKYYLGMAVDVSNVQNQDQQQSPVDVTYYLKNLTTDGPLESVTIRRDNQKYFHGSDTPFTIGNRSGMTAAKSFDGIIEEMRVSDELLPESDLLINKQ